MRLVLLVLAVLLLGPAAQASDLKLATWNLNWLTLRPAGDPALPPDVRPREPEDFDILRRYALALAADVVAFQEVDGSQPASRVFGSQPASRVFTADRYDLYLTADEVLQRVGFAVRKGLHAVQNADLSTLDVTAEGHLRSGADITLDWPGGRLRLLAVHLKTGCARAQLTQAIASCAVLRAQAAPLADWIAARRREGVPFVVLGDFNREMDGRDAFLRSLRTAGPLVRATENRSSPCWGGGGFVDHILAGGAAIGWMRPDSLRVLVYRETATPEHSLGREASEEKLLKERLSDHCPVSVRLRLPD
jgi:endonuclease/exonuclease/phosphatase family metal-dependent hydrolase